MREWMIRHPEAVGVIFGALASYIAVTAFDTGLVLGAARALSGEADRLASEALGG